MVALVLVNPPRDPLPPRKVEAKSLKVQQDTSGPTTHLVVLGPSDYEYRIVSLSVILDFPGWDVSGLPSELPIKTPDIESVQVKSLKQADGTSVARVQVRLVQSLPLRVYAQGPSVHLILDAPSETAGSVPLTKVGPSETSVPQPSPSPAPTRSPAPMQSQDLMPPAPGGGQEEARTHRASLILGITHSRRGAQLIVTIRANGSLVYKDFVIHGPDRLVVDFSDVLLSPSVRAVSVDDPPVRRIRAAQFSLSPRVVRLVVDLLSPMPYRIVNDSAGASLLMDYSSR